MILITAGGKFYNKLKAVGLYGSFMSRAVTLDLAAFSTLVNYDIALFGVCFNAYRLHFAAALGGSVARVYIKVERP